MSYQQQPQQPKYCDRCQAVGAWTQVYWQQTNEVYPPGHPKQGRYKFRLTDVATGQLHQHDARVPRYQGQGPPVQQQQYPPQQQYPQQQQPPGPPPNLQPGYQDPAYAAPQSNYNAQEQTAVKECPQCAQGGAPGQMIYIVQEAFDQSTNQPIYGIYDHNPQFPNMHNTRHQHRAMQSPNIGVAAMQTPQNPPGNLPSVPLQTPTPPNTTGYQPGPVTDQEKFNAFMESRERKHQDEMDVITRHYFRMEELMREMVNQQMGTIRIIETRAARVITILKATLSLERGEKIDELRALTPTAKVEYREEFNSSLHPFTESEDYMNDPVLHKAINFYKDPKISNAAEMMETKEKLLKEQEEESQGGGIILEDEEVPDTHYHLGS